MKIAKNGEILQILTFFEGMRGEKCAEMSAEKAKKCAKVVAGGAYISESNGRCFASETIGASK